MAVYVIPFIGTFVFSMHAYAQGCCSGGSGSPIAGGTSQGVLADRQAEISASFQYINTNRFQKGTKRTKNFLDNYSSEYLYTRLAYGVTERFTLSLESGYYFDRTQVSLSGEKITSSGIGDVILFPRYTVYTHNTERTRDEITLGVGFKMPVGKYLDSSVVYVDPVSGKVIYASMPPVVMPTTGSQDFIFYGFGYRGYPEKKVSLFTSILYVKKGWNPIGQRFGDYASIGLFAGKTFHNKFGITLQLKGEWVDVMKYDKNIDFIAKYNFDVVSTGGQKLLFVPQLNYSYKNLAVYLLSEVPLYQYVNGTAIASQYLFTMGFSYRFMTVKMNEESEE
jgi:hypothetical protein